MMAICFNMHIEDAWEHADDPRYLERFSSFAYRMGINYIIYPMTHYFYIYVSTPPPLVAAPRLQKPY